MLNEYSKNVNNINFEKNINNLKDILIPPIKEIEARNLVNYYIKNFKEKNNNNNRNINNDNNNINNNLNNKNKNKEIEQSTIYDYSFMNDKYLKKINKKKEKRKSYKKKNEKSIYERNIERQKEKEKKLELMRKEEEKKNYKEIQNKPNIYEKSKKIIKNNIEPVYIRLNNDKNKNKNKNNNNNNVINDNEYKIDKKFNEEEFNYWLKLNTTREQMKRAKLNYLKKEIEENNKLINENFENNLTFKPKINKNSQKICDIKYNNNFENRLIEYQNEKNQKLEQIYKENTPSFIPKINEFFFS